MCGIAGFIDPTLPSAKIAPQLEAMLGCLVHRGPDDSGIWLDDGVALGHRRLSILDLSPAGHQPMSSASGRYVIVLNGEIYNHGALRQELVAAGVSFRGHSDTEILVELIDRLGLVAAVARCIGMFAFALWDRREHVLSLARDRMGEKPLYYALCGSRFLFASELRALEAHPALPREINLHAVAALVRYGFIPSPSTIYRGVAKLQHGHYLRLDCSLAGARQGAAGARLELREYWSHCKVMAAGAQQRFSGRLEEASDRLEGLLTDSIRMQMQADVPVGAFLSGGIDSSTVVAIMQEQATLPIRTFSIGFDDSRMDESPDARAVATHLGTMHHELIVTGREALATVPRLPELFDEPLADPSLIPTYHVARIARQHVTVSLSGDGGDELFGGYHKYQLGLGFKRLPARSLLARAMAFVPAKAIEQTAALAGEPGRRMFSAHRFATVRRLLRAPGDLGLAEALVAVNASEHGLTAVPTDAPRIGGPELLACAGTYLERAMLLDRNGYLPDNVLTKVDRATMAVSLESRAPLLDHRIVEFAATLPTSYLVRGRATKRVLRALLHRRVPPSMVERPKQGFSPPLGPWLRSGLREWAGDLIGACERLAPGILDAEGCRRMFDLHLTSGADQSLQLWPILTYLSWAERRRP